MSEIPVLVSDRALEPHVPENNSVESKGNKIFYGLKQSTRPSKVARSNERSERSLDLRARRADIYKKVVETEDPEKRKELLKEAHARDEIEAQYLSQGEVKVNMPGLGEQVSRYTMIESPEGYKSLEDDDQPTIFLIPGISNDLDSVGGLIKEIPLQGRNVVAAGMPDSQMGHVTADFVDAVENSSTLEPHVNFMKAAINELIGQGQPVELWGMSAGSMVVAEILNDPEFSERVKRAVLLSPAGTSEQGVKKQTFGVVKEAVRVFKNPSKGAHYSLTMSRHEDQIPKSEEEKALATRVFNSVREKTLQKFGPYRTMQVAEGGQITVVTGRKDDMTRSTESNSDFRSHPQVELISLKNGVHNTPIIEAEKLVPKVLDRQKLADVRSEISKL